MKRVILSCVVLLSGLMAQGPAHAVCVGATQIPPPSSSKSIQVCFTQAGLGGWVQLVTCDQQNNCTPQGNDSRFGASLIVVTPAVASGSVSDVPHLCLGDICTPASVTIPAGRVIIYNPILVYDANSQYYPGVDRICISTGNPAC